MVLLDALMLPGLYPHQIFPWVNSVHADFEVKLLAVSFLVGRIGRSSA